jgi:MFS family permease
VASLALRGWAGWAADRYGRRPFMLAGCAIFTAAPLAYATSGGVASLFLARLAHGAGMGLCPTAATAMVADIAPPARRAEMLGVFGMAGSLALALGPAAGVVLVRSLGFSGLFATAAAVAAISVACVLLVPETLTVRETRAFRVADTVSAGALLPSALMFAVNLTYGALVTFLPLHADARAVNPGVFFLAYALSLTATRQPAGRLSDRRGRAPVATVGLLVLAGALAILAFADGTTGIVLGGIVYGIGQGIVHPVLIAWAVDGAAAGARGRAMGTIGTALELGIALGGITAGLVVARVGFTVTCLAAAGIVVAAAALAVTRTSGRL